MAILYVRNEDGEFVSVPAIVGPKGDRGEPGTPGAPGRIARNYLDNSDFMHPVNQRGITDSYDTAGYKIDRWRSQRAIYWSVSDLDGLHIMNNGTANNGIAQYFEPGAVLHVGQVVTLACADMEGNLYCGAVTVPQSGSVNAFVSADGSFFGMVFSPEAANGPRVQLMLKPGASIALRWAALYDGAYTADTLPEYVPKGYAAELLECQRYFVRYGREVVTPAYSVQYGEDGELCDFRMTLHLPVTMRGRMTLSFPESDGDYIFGPCYAYCGETRYDLSPVNTADNKELPYGPFVTFSLPVDGGLVAPGSRPAVCMIPCIDISADL